MTSVESPGMDDFTTGESSDEAGHARRRVLIISYCYPPLATMGTVRPTKLVKYLPGYGWESTVLTVAEDKTKWVRDQMCDEREGTEIVRAPFPDILSFARSTLSRAGIVKPGDPGADSVLTVSAGPSSRSGAGLLQRTFSLAKSWASFPDRYLLWAPFAIAAGLREMKRNAYDAILSSTPPVTNHIVASALARLTGVPWLADYRDPFTGNAYWEHTRVQRLVAPALERLILRPAGAVTTVSRPLADDLEALLGDRPAGVHEVTNGYDPDDFTGDVTPRAGVFSLTFTGLLYGGKRELRPLLEVIEDLVSEGRVDPAKIRVRMFGPVYPELEEARDRLRHPEIVEINGVVSRGVSIEMQRKSTVLLNVIWDDPYTAKGYGGKIFEYLAAGRPVLAWNPSGGVLDDLIQRTGAGVSVKDGPALKAVLEEWLDEFDRTGTVTFRGDPDEVRKYGWDRLSGEFAGILDRLVSNDSASGG